MIFEAQSLAHLQIGKEIPKAEYTTLHSDATTKFGKSTVLFSFQ